MSTRDVYRINKKVECPTVHRQPNSIRVLIGSDVDNLLRTPRHRRSSSSHRNRSYNVTTKFLTMKNFCKSRGAGSCHREKYARSKTTLNLLLIYRHKTQTVIFSDQNWECLYLLLIRTPEIQERGGQTTTYRDVHPTLPLLRHPSTTLIIGPALYYTQT